MKILVIGAKGMLGQELVDTFSADYEVLAWDREEIDITLLRQGSGGQADRILEAGPDLLINAAAYNDVDGAEEKQELAGAVNGHAVGNLAKICTQLNIPVIYYSTEYVFGGEKEAGYTEADNPNPISAYGRSKYLGERELMKNTEMYYLIRLSRLFGRPAQSGAGKKSFIQLMRDLAETNDQLDVVDEELSSPTYAPDLAELTRKIVEEDHDYGIYHGANDGACTWYGFAKELFEILDKDVKLNPVPASKFPRPAKRPKYGVLRNTKLPRQRTWQTALREYLIFNSDQQTP